MSLLDEFLKEVETFLDETKVDPSTFGRNALNDPNFIRNLRIDGRSPHLRTVEKVREFMAEHRARADTPESTAPPPAEAHAQ